MMTKQKKPTATATATATTTATATAKRKPASKAVAATNSPALSFRGQRWAFFGDFAIWPSYHGCDPAGVAHRRGATIVVDVADAEVVVMGDLRGTGRAEAKKRADRALAAGAIQLLDEAAYRELVRIDLSGKRFAFIGGFALSPTETDTTILAQMVARAGGIVHPAVDATLDYLVVGSKRGPSKIALLNQARRLRVGGAKTVELDETGFVELVRIDAPAAASAELDFTGFMGQLYGYVEEKKLGRAMTMLREDRLHLYSTIDEDRLVGVVKSQSMEGTVYASWLTSAGAYNCTDPNLDACGGLMGRPCKHLLVLVVGLARTKQLPIVHALAWLRAAHSRGPRADTTICAETLIQYKGAAAGEIDWRPTETIPEDFYAV